jgi:hypothetical protein
MPSYKVVSGTLADESGRQHGVEEKVGAQNLYSAIQNLYSAIVRLYAWRP